MPDPKKQLYFIAIVPPQAIANKVHDLKLHFLENYQSKAALNSPAHITLHMPFEWGESKEEVLIKSLREFSGKQKTFELVLADFGAFPPRVIFLNVLPSQGLEVLQHDLHQYCKKRLNLFNARYGDQPYHPHMTLAFRDLRKTKFHTAWEEFRDKTFNAVFTCDSIALMKHDGKRWELLVSCQLSQV